MLSIKEVDDYYINQAGTGLAGFEGLARQKGKSIWGSIWKFARPILGFLGKQALGAVHNVASDVLQNEVPIADALKKRLVETGKATALHGLDQVKERVSQLGTGRKRKRRKSIKGKKRPTKRRKTSEIPF